MKRLIIFFFIFFAVALFFVINNFFSSSKVLPGFSHTFQITEPTNTPMQSASTALFVPYWTLGDKALPATYNTVIYFGISANASGINTTDSGYKDIASFIRLAGLHQKKLLTVELLDQVTNEKALHDNVFAQKIVNQSVAIVKQYGFDGVLVDLEYKALAFDEVVQSTTNFSTDFAKTAHENHLLFYQALYGDTFYRLRPFDTAAVGKVSDGIFVLAYDFHKANGNPGPNFPLSEMPDENYSFTQMVHDFADSVPISKLTIVLACLGTIGKQMRKDSLWVKQKA